MYHIHICVQCPEECSELLPDKLEQAEMAVEVLVSQALQELFKVVLVEDVSVTFMPLKATWGDSQL